MYAPCGGILLSDSNFTIDKNKVIKIKPGAEGGGATEEQVEQINQNTADVNMALSKIQDLNTSLGETNTVVQGLSEDVDNIEAKVNDLEAAGGITQTVIWEGAETGNVGNYTIPLASDLDFANYDGLLITMRLNNNTVKTYTRYLPLNSSTISNNGVATDFTIASPSQTITGDHQVVINWASIFSLNIFNKDATNPNQIRIGASYTTRWNSSTGTVSLDNYTHTLLRVVGIKINTPSVETGYLTEAPQYSLAEQLTPKLWVDGKPIYTKTIQFQRDASEQVAVDLGIPDFDTIRIVEADYIINNANITTLPWVTITPAGDFNALVCYIHKASKKIVSEWLKSEEYTTAGTIRVIVEYTKTTDQGSGEIV